MLSGLRSARHLIESSAFRTALGYLSLFSLSSALLLLFIQVAATNMLQRQVEATIDAEIRGLAEHYRSFGLAGLSQTLRTRTQRPVGSSLYLFTDPHYNPLAGNLSGWPVESTTRSGWLRFTLSLGDDNSSEPRRYPALARHFVLRGGYHLLVGQTLESLERMSQLLSRILLWGFGVTTLLGLIGAALLGQRTLRRIEAINATCRGIEAGALEQRVPPLGGGSDFDELEANLNRMLARIEGLMAGMRQVSSGIAHDLRTPLARLRSRLESLQQAVDGAARDQVDQALGEADRLLDTFSALLRIAQAEGGMAGTELEPLDLKPLIEDVIDLYEPLASDREQVFEVSLAPVRIRGARHLLFQALANLLDNAIKYTPPRGRIRILCSAGERYARIDIADDGPGIPPDARSRVLERFVRLEDDQTVPGSGLGLSLVAAVARLHNAELRLADNGPGLRVIIERLSLAP